MSTPGVSTMGPATGHRGHPFGGGRRWTPPNTIAVVLGFVFFGPFGLFLLAWVMLGRDVRELPGAVRRLWAATFGGRDGDGRFDLAGFGAGFGERSNTGNAVFDDYQRTQYDRIREIREEVRSRSRRFAEFRSSAQRRADEEEFKRFMANAPEGDGRA